MISRVLSYLRISFLRRFGRARGVARGAWIHYTADITQQHPWQILIEAGALVDKHTWLNVPIFTPGRAPVLVIGKRARVGRNNVISAKNGIVIGEGALLGPQVLLMDHGHQFNDLTIPIAEQGTTDGGRVLLEAGCWIGFGAAVIASRGTLIIGRNSIVGANSVVTSDVEPYTVVAGAPARVVRRYDASTQSWVRSAPVGNRELVAVAPGVD